MWYNKIMVWILKSPLHSIISSGIMIIGFKGSKSGKKYSTPVNYLNIEDKIYVMSDRTRIWWKTLLGILILTFILSGKIIPGPV